MTKVVNYFLHPDT